MIGGEPEVQVAQRACNGDAAGVQRIATGRGMAPTDWNLIQCRERPAHLATQIVGALEPTENA